MQLIVAENFGHFCAMIITFVRKGRHHFSDAFTLEKSLTDVTHALFDSLRFGCKQGHLEIRLDSGVVFGQLYTLQTSQNGLLDELFITAYMSSIYGNGAKALFLASHFISGVNALL